MLSGVTPLWQKHSTEQLTSDPPSIVKFQKLLLSLLNIHCAETLLLVDTGSATFQSLRKQHGQSSVVLILPGLIYGILKLSALATQT